MKIRSNSNSISIPVVLAAGLVSACSATAQDMDSGAGGKAGSFYVSGDAGVAILQNMTLSFGGFSAPVTYNVGPRVDVSAGYNITQNIAVELQAGFAYNSWSQFEGVSVSAEDLSSDLWTVPVMANGIYTYAFNDHWSVYGGAGAGVVISTWDVSQFGLSESATDEEFGYQAMAGIKYRITDHLEAGLGYNFLGTLDHHWAFTGFGYDASPTYMHSILLSLTYKF